MPNITLTSKYVEDASGNKFAPITTPNAVRFSDGDTLNDKLIQSDWNQSSSSAIDYIKNKPTALPANGGNAATVNSHTVLSNVPANAVFTDTTYSVMGASGSSHASGLVPDTPSTAGTTKFLREDGTWQVPTADVSGKEDKMSIVQMASEDEPTSTLSPAVNTLYIITSASTLDVTLPTITDTTKVQSFVMMLYFSSSNPSITIHGTQDNICAVYMPTDISLEEGKAYEINCMFLGRITTQPPGGQSITYNNWSVAIRDVGEANLG